MFNSKHYVPMLKWKRAEQGALEVLTSENKKYITPVIQFVMPKQKPQDTLEDVVARFKKQLLILVCYLQLNLKSRVSSRF